MRVPIFLVNGMLESGKSAFIQNLIEKPAFGDGQITLLICCEEGEIEYSSSVLKKQNIVKVEVESEESITGEFLEGLKAEHNPTRVIIEFNGVWDINNLFDTKLPENWALYQSVVIVNGETFNLYLSNMKGIFVEYFKTSDLVVVNRVDDKTDLSLLKGLIKTLSPNTNILVSTAEFEMSVLDEELPFDISKDTIIVSPEHYGAWYIDLWEHGEHYKDKKISIAGLFFQAPDDPKDHFHFGRFAMPCCEDDVTFLGVYCKNIGKPKFNNKDSISIEAKIIWEKAEAYQGEGPVLYVSKISKSDESQEGLVSF